MTSIENFLNRLATLGDDIVKRQRTKALLCYGPEIVNTINRVSEIKNLLYRSKPAKIVDIFVEPDILLHETTLSASDLFGSFVDNERIILRGSAGLGKSVLLKQFCLRHIDLDLSFAPLFLELRKIEAETAGDIAQALYAAYNTTTYPLKLEEFRNALQSRTFSVLLDGFDEIKPDLRDKIEASILRFANEFPACPLIISGRSERSFESWERFTVYDIAPMSEKLTVDLINKLEIDVVIKERFVNEAIPKLFSNQDRSFVQTPLLAILMLLTYGMYADIPDRMHIFYANAFETLLRDHDITKSQFRRPLASGIAEEDFKRLFSAFCAITYAKRQFEFTIDDIERYLGNCLTALSMKARIRAIIDDLTLSICVMQYENLEYSFVHRSFQEYFTALYLRDSPINVVDTFIKRHKGRSENVIPMLMGMDRDRIEKEWSINELEELESHFIAESPEARVELVLRRYWEKVSYTSDGSKGSRSMSPPASDIYKNFVSLEFVYPGESYPMWWLADFDARASRLDRARASPVAAKYLVNKVDTDEGHIQSNSPSGLLGVTAGEYEFDLRNITFLDASALEFVSDAEVFLAHLDNNLRDIRARVGHRDAFSESLFEGQ